MAVTSPALGRGSSASVSDPSDSHSFCLMVSQDSHNDELLFPISEAEGPPCSRRDDGKLLYMGIAAS